MTDEGPRAAESVTLAARQLRGSTLLLAGQLVAVGTAFATQVLVVRYLSKSGYGAFAFALSIVAIAQTASTLGLNRTIARFVPIYHERGEDERALGAIALAAVAIAVAGAAAIVAAFAAKDVLGRSVIGDEATVAVLVVLIALVPLQAIDELFTNVFASFSDARAIFARTYVLSPVSKLVVVAVLVAAGRGVRFLAAGYAVAAAIVLAISAALLVRRLRREGLLRKVSPAWNALPVRDVVALAGPLLAADLAYFVLTFADAVLLGLFKGPLEVASFRAVQPVARLNELVFLAFLTLFAPLAARLFARNDRDALSTLYWRTAAWIAVASFPVFALTFGAGKPLTVGLFGERYESSAVVLTILAVGYYVQAAFGFNGTTIVVFGRTGYVLALSGAAVALNLVANVLLIPPFGAVGAAVATTTAFVLHNALKQLALRRATGLPLFDAAYARVYATIGAAMVALVIARTTFADDGLAAFGFAIAASACVVYVNRSALSLAETFPELLRVPFLGRILRAA